MMGLVWSLVEGIDGQKWARGRSHKIKNGPQKSRMLVRGSGDQVHLFQHKFFTPGREQTHLLQKEGAQGPPLCLSPHCPLHRVSFFTLPSWPSSFLALFLSSSFLPSLSLSSPFFPLSPFLLYSPSSFTFPSLTYSLLDWCPLRSLLFYRY